MAGEGDCNALVQEQHGLARLTAIWIHIARDRVARMIIETAVKLHRMG